MSLFLTHVIQTPLLLFKVKHTRLLDVGLLDEGLDPYLDICQCLLVQSLFLKGLCSVPESLDAVGCYLQSRTTLLHSLLQPGGQHKESTGL